MIRAAFPALILSALQMLLAQQPSPFVSITPAPSDTLQFGALLPEVEVKDIRGRIWHLRDLHGKFTLIYLWTTFEARAVDAHDAHLHEVVSGLSNLPAVQRFHDS